jgi:hypothetical protein
MHLIAQGKVAANETPPYFRGPSHGFSGVERISKGTFVIGAIDELPEGARWNIGAPYPNVVFATQPVNGAKNKIQIQARVQGLPVDIQEFTISVIGTLS